jgi:hypothetical protein
MKNSIIISQILLYIVTSAMRGGENQRVWIYFKDKGQIESKDFAKFSKQQLSERSIIRRANKSIPIKYDFTDLPVYEHYVKKLKNNAISIIHRSKWLNAVSAYIHESQYKKLLALNFVEKIKPVKSFKFKGKEKTEESTGLKRTNLEYGPSFNQNDMLGIPAYHTRGYAGNGIRIAVFDTGFKTSHNALSSLNVITSWDFVENDAIVFGFPGENHGAEVLGVIAGYSIGNLIGPAYEAEYLLAKTDDYVTETHLDEDNWIAAAEWADQHGADIITSSVGYNIFDSGQGDYIYPDMDGNTTIITIAADLAVKKGIAVFTTAGNEGNTGWYYVLAPADGDSVIAVGAVTSSGNVTSFSSRGPTYDGRLKPDLVAQGSQVYTINVSDENNYTSKEGTSYSTPLAAGAGALVLSVMPFLTPMQLYDSLTTNASSYHMPNNDIGYGIPNIGNIIRRLEKAPGVIIDSLKVIPREGRNIVEWTSHIETLNKNWKILRKDTANILYELKTFPGHEFSNQKRLYRYIDLEIDSNKDYKYFLKAEFVDGTSNIIDSSRAKSLRPFEFTIIQNFPNPFNSFTTIVIGLNQDAKYSLTIFNILGQKIKTIQKNSKIKNGYQNYTWRGINDQGNAVSSGIYFAVVRSSNSTKSIKLIFFK